VWVTPNGADGRLVRVDVRSGQVSARISAHPVYFGSVLAFGAGFVWTGNDDERYRRGTTVSKLDPGTNHLVGRPLALGSPQSIAFGAGAVWVADHAGWLVKIDPRTLEVVARQRLDFGPHGVVATRDGVYVADAHGSRLLEADPRTARIRRVADLPVGPIYPAAGAGSIWSGSAAVWGNATDRTTGWSASTRRPCPSPRPSTSAATSPPSPSASAASGPPSNPASWSASPRRPAASGAMTSRCAVD
jgi:hypothetical protein